MKLFYARKRDLNGLNLEGGATTDPIKIGCCAELRGGILQNSSESPRFWVLRMEGKRLHTADFGLLRIFLVYTKFTYSRIHHSNAVKLSINNVGIKFNQRAKDFECSKISLSTK